MTIAAIGITILILSIAGAVWRAGKSAAGQPRQIKVLHFMLYFWAFAFVQLGLAAIAYALLVR